MDMRIVVVGFLETNCYLVTGGEGKETMIIDPGADPERIAGIVEKNGLKPVFLALTHGHHDHTGALTDLQKKWSIPVVLHEKEAGFLNIPPSERVPLSEANGSHAFIVVNDGDEVKFDGLKLKVIHTPGHTPGGSCYLSEDQNLVFTGDTLFCDGVGRTDFEGGDYDKLMDGIRKKLMALPEEMKIYPGHGPSSTIGREKRYF